MRGTLDPITDTDDQFLLRPRNHDTDHLRAILPLREGWRARPGSVPKIYLFRPSSCFRSIKRRGEETVGLGNVAGGKASSPFARRPAQLRPPLPASLRGEVR